MGVLLSAPHTQPCMAVASLTDHFILDMLITQSLLQRKKTKCTSNKQKHDNIVTLRPLAVKTLTLAVHNLWKGRQRLTQQRQQ